MFGKLGQLASLMGNLPKITAEMEKLQERIAKLSAEGDAGGGMVRVKVTGQCKLISCTISPETVAGGERKHARELAAALQAVAETVHTCPECGNLADGPLCSVCSNPRRDPAVLCVVETPRDLAIFERAGFFRGRYHVLGGRLAPLDN